MEGLKKAMEKLGIVGVPVENQTGHFLNKRHRVGQLVRSRSIAPSGLPESSLPRVLGLYADTTIAMPDTPHVGPTELGSSCQAVSLLLFFFVRGPS
jgi:hypothetical protein